MVIEAYLRLAREENNRAIGRLMRTDRVDPLF